MDADILTALQEAEKSIFSIVENDSPAIIICAWQGKAAADALTLYSAVQQSLKQNKLSARVEVMQIDGSNLTGLEPVVMLLPAKVTYVNVGEKDVDEIVQKTLRKGKVISRLVFDPNASQPSRRITLEELQALALGQTAGTAAGEQITPEVDSAPGQDPEFNQSITSDSADGEHVSLSPDAAEPAVDGRLPGGEVSGSAPDLGAEAAVPSTPAETGDAVLPEETEELLPVLIPRTLKLFHPKKIERLKLEDRSNIEKGTAESLKAEYTAHETFLAERAAVISGTNAANPDEAEFLTVSELFTKFDDSNSPQNASVGSEPVTGSSETNPETEGHLPQSAGPAEEAASAGTAEEEIPADEQPGTTKENAPGRIIPDTTAAVNKKDLSGIAQALEMATLSDQMAALEKLKSELVSEFSGVTPQITVCAGDGCCAQGALAVFEAFQERIEHFGLGVTVELKKTGCRGLCGQGPLVMLMPATILYVQVKPADAEKIIQETFLKGNVIPSLLYQNPQSGKKILLESAIPFYKLQTRILTKDLSRIDPESIGDYLAVGGYEALAKALTLPSDEIIKQIENSRLRGRGGAGFPTWKKWDVCRKEHSGLKYVVVNGNAADPGSMDDPALMAANPHLILEGLIIGAYAVQATRGFIYVRTQFKSALKQMEKAVEDAYHSGLLGKKILNSNFNFDVIVHLGANSYISGEETSLLNAIEGNWSEPRPRPPYPAKSGLWGKPTLVNNVKTWASIPAIIRNGGEWYAQTGSKKSGGTTLVSLTGPVKNPGYAEVRLGTPLSTIINGIGGGAVHGKLKAVQTGGITGGFVPEENWDVLYDYETLQKAGTDFGSVLHACPENTCIIFRTMHALEEIRDEACGRCSSCRIGIPQMIKLMEYIVNNNSERQDLITLKDLANTVRDSSMCKLGQNASMVVLASMNDYPKEYEAHLRGKCPGGNCPDMVQYRVDPERCTACGKCQVVCPVTAIFEADEEKRMIESSICIRCGYCYNVCDDNAIYYQ